MMKWMFVLFMVCGSAQADELTAGLLYKFCNAADEAEQTACRFYISGVVHGAALVDGSAMTDDERFVPKKKTIFCEPRNAPPSLMVDIFRKQMQSLLQKHPEDANLPASPFVLAAMHGQFPCPK